MSKKTASQKATEPVFEKFHFPNIGRLRPVVYVPLLYLLALLLILYFGFFHLSDSKVELRFYPLSGESSLYVDGRYHSNLNFAPGWSASKVILSAGHHTLRIEKAGMEPWILEKEFRANIWNNRWKPRSYEFTVQMTQTAPTHYIWQEAWRAYLYRGLEGQKELSFDASHPYPWVLSEGLRSVLYSYKELPESDMPAFWSADFQRGLASTTSIYQWGDILTAYSLAMQIRANQGSPQNTNNLSTNNPGIGILGPKSIALLSRSAIKRFSRLKPSAESLLYAWEKAEKEQPKEALKEDIGQTSVKELLEAILSQKLENSSSVVNNNNEEIALGRQITLEGIRFIAIPGQDFAMQQTGVSNAQFARFWFRPDRTSGTPPRNVETLPRSVAELVLDTPDHTGLPLGWPETDNIDDILQNQLLQDQPVRGITWEEASAFASWLQQRTNRTGEAGSSWQITLPTAEDRKILFETLEALDKGQVLQSPKPALDFRIPEAPPSFSQQESDLLGLKGLGAVLWEWLAEDYLPFSAGRSQNGSSDLLYKAVAGGSWVNALPIENETRDLWTAEFLSAGNELPFAATPSTVAGQFAALRSPYTGFRLIARKKRNEKN